MFHLLMKVELKLQPPYWTTKLLLEKILEDLSHFSAFNVVNLRYFNPILAHVSWKLWGLPEWKTNNLFPYMFKFLSWTLDELNVFGDSYDTLDWTWVRDYIDVDDLIDAHILAYTKISIYNTKWNIHTYNVWTWKWESVLEVIQKIEKQLWKKVKYKIVKERNWDVAVSFCDTSKINNELWWKSA